MTGRTAGGATVTVASATSTGMDTDIGTNVSPKKRRRTSRGPAQAARHAAFIASMEQDTDNTHT